MTAIRAYAAHAPGARLEPWSYDPGRLGDEEVEVAVESCGLCHSDLSMLDDAWRQTRFPLVPGHEVIGRVVAAGSRVRRLATGDRVGIGWSASSCMACRACLAGDAHLCPSVQGTIVGRHGGFAERVRAHWAWAIPLPDALDPATAGPLLCGGITVFSPLVEFGVRPTDRVAVVGIGGLGHLALRFLRHWGCEVTAFTSTDGKHDEARRLGAHHVATSTDRGAWKRHAGAFDFILVTVNVALPWDALLGAVAARGRLHFVGAVPEPVPVRVGALIGAQRSVSGSPTGSPVRIADMLGFCARHAIAPSVEPFPLARVNDALEHLRAGRARYRVVLVADAA